MTWKSRLVVLTGAMLLGMSSVATGEVSFVGAKKCRACHLKQFSHPAEVSPLTAHEEP